ncbi:hypothetical protein F2P81_009880 [Scophthalmus maximus]|uniref:Fringe-like glycosyltransferase domain-containing protein n=1 Tax=Scophthalmus maximus TaxID=52904 RepID=A0A6A4SPG3_SCOMX|nr:hypothetical protein F2P81_009880 [Scophthalmus maximus]
MHKRWTRRRLPVLVFTFSIILYVDFQLRTSSNPPTLRALPRHPPPGGALLLQRAIQQAPDAAAEDARRAAAGDPTSAGAARHHVTRPDLGQEDIFIAVKTTGRFHETRLALLLETWISRTKAHTFIFTDMEDEDVSSEGYNVVVTGCQSDHSQQALSCKMSAEYDGFMASDKRCRKGEIKKVNNRKCDGEMNSATVTPLEAVVVLYGGRCVIDIFGRIFRCVRNTLELNGLCDIYVGKPSLDKPITAHELLEGNATVTLSYGMFENKMNSIEVKGGFSKEDDPSSIFVGNKFISAKKSGRECSSRRTICGHGVH